MGVDQTEADSTIRTLSLRATIGQGVSRRNHPIATCDLTSNRSALCEHQLALSMTGIGNSVLFSRISILRATTECRCRVLSGSKREYGICHPSRGFKCEGLQRPITDTAAIVGPMRTDSMHFDGR
jgi:hypothetical protein